MVMVYDTLSANGGLVRRSFSIRDWFRILITDRVILGSLALFVTVLFGFVYVVLDAFSGQAVAPPLELILLQGSIIAYVVWSLYWGVPGCIQLLWRLRNRALFGFSMLGFGAIGAFLIFSACALVLYPPFGGGVLHFLRRSWLSAKRAESGDVRSVATSASLHARADESSRSSPIAETQLLQPAPPESRSDIEQRLRALAHLHERGLISRDEHDRVRMSILEKL
jgi:signal transduction histidine kinase